MSKALDFLCSARPFYYATVEDGKPKVRPFGFCMEFEGKLYFGMGKQKKSFKQTFENPYIEVCACNAEKQWIRVYGKAVLDDRQEVMDKAFEVNPNLKMLYNETTGNVLGNFYLEDGEAEIMDMKGNFEKFKV